MKRPVVKHVYGVIILSNSKRFTLLHPIHVTFALLQLLYYVNIYTISENANHACYKLIGFSWVCFSFSNVDLN